MSVTFLRLIIANISQRLLGQPAEGHNIVPVNDVTS